MGHLIRVKHRGSFKNLERFLKRAKEERYLEGLKKYGEAGAVALCKATPMDSGETAASWSYFIEKIDNGYRIVWTNDNRNDGALIAVLLQYGHATGSGGYVQGIDYINPAMRNIFCEIAENAWREVTK